MIAQRRVKHAAFQLSVLCCVLSCIGLIAIYSSSSVFALEKCHDAAYYLKKQILGLVLALGAACVARYVPLAWLYTHAFGLFLLSWCATLTTLLAPSALQIHGSSRWITIAGQSFQPSELLKIGLILYAARFLTVAQTRNKRFLTCYAPLLLIVGMSSLVLLKQPDFGLTVTLVVTIGLMTFATPLPLSYLAWTASAGLPVLIGLAVARPYRLKRILTFLDPWADPRGAGFQIIQSLIAIGSGGWSGVGIGNSKQKFFYLPMQHTDFIFSIIAEETGLIGSLLLIGLFVGLLYVGLKLASLMQDMFSYLVCVGFTVLMSLQAAINIAVSAGLVPTKGIGMPFISYGNSSLIAWYICIGLMLNCARTAQHSSHVWRTQARQPGVY